MVCIAVGVLGLAGASQAAAAAGQAAFNRYCASCHGTGAKGDGPVAQYMTPKPPDLTQLAKNSGGTFPTLRVISIIDGRDPIRAHGDRQMPVWGEEFTRARSQTVGAQAQVRGQIQEIATYLQSIQAK
jgi:mono/diheme cytochrome c family protein